jgi:outer membrane protein assembly factor BamB
MNLRILLLLAGLVSVVAKAQEPPAAVTNLWSTRLPDRGTESSPALAPDGTIYQGTFHGWLVAFTPEGKTKWKFKAGLEIKSSPAIASDGTIVFGSRDGKCYALIPQGKLKWFFATGGWVDSSPAIAADGTVYFGSWDSNFYALNPNGNLKWKFMTGGIISASPAISAEGTIYFGSHDRNFYALNPDGTLKWKFATGAEIIASAAIGGDGAVYFTSTDGNFYAVNPDGTQRWRLHTGGFTRSSPVTDEQGNLLLAVNKERFSVSPDGKVRWHFGGNNPIDSSSVMLADGRIFTSGPWTPSGLMTPESNFQWAFHVGYGFYSSPNVSPSGVIYLPDEQYLYALMPATNPAPMANSSWPMWRANPQHTGRVSK